MRALKLAVVTIISLVCWQAVLADTLTWDDGAGDDNWSSGANWVGDPASGPADGDSVILTPTAQSRLDYVWTIESGQSLTSTATGLGDELIIEGGLGTLTLASGASMDIRFMRPRFVDGGKFVIEAGASLNTDYYGLGIISGDITFVADAEGVTLWNTPNTFDPRLDNLTVDLSNYDTANGDTLVLVDYGTLSGAFASTNIIGASGTLDYTYDIDGNGNLGIALTIDPPVEWDGGAGDGLWTSATNWSDNTVPAAGDSIIIDGASVTVPSGFLPANAVLNLTGTASIGGTGVTRFINAGATINVGPQAVIGANNQFWDIRTVTIAFDSGAQGNQSVWELKESPSFRFKLNASGFTTIAATRMKSETDPANITWTVDMADYTGNGGVITLMDFATCDSGTATDMTAARFQWGTLNILNEGDYEGSALSWDESTNEVLLTIPKVIKGTVILVL